MIEATKDKRGKLIYECPGVYPNRDETIENDQNRTRANKSIIQHRGCVRSIYIVFGGLGSRRAAMPNGSMGGGGCW